MPSSSRSGPRYRCSRCRAEALLLTRTLYLISMIFGVSLPSSLFGPLLFYFDAQSTTIHALFFFCILERRVPIVGKAALLAHACGYAISSSHEERNQDESLFS